MTLDELIHHPGTRRIFRQQRCWLPRRCAVSGSLLWLGQHDRLVFVRIMIGDYEIRISDHSYWLHRDVVLQYKLMIA